jgi:uncharacterized protein YjiS (DUF1127 family)
MLSIPSKPFPLKRATRRKCLKPNSQSRSEAFRIVAGKVPNKTFFPPKEFTTMTTYAAKWDDAIAGSRPTRSVFERTVESLRRAWARRNTNRILSDLDDHMLSDIGVDPREVRTNRPMAGWLVRAQARMPGLVFLGH